MDSVSGLSSGSFFLLQSTVLCLQCYPSVGEGNARSNHFVKNDTLEFELDGGEGDEDDMLDVHIAHEDSRAVPIGQRYAEYLFRELCGGLLNQYSDFVDVLYSPIDGGDIAARLEAKRQHHSRSSSSGAPSAQLFVAPRGAVHQTIAEYEYFKVL